MPDWKSTMQQSFDFYIVDPLTWGDKQRIDTIKTCSISWDETDTTLGSATIDCTEDLGECYLRVYMLATQNKVTDRICMGTFLVQTPSTKFNGKSTSISLDAYTPLITLKDSAPPLGYTIPKGSNIMEYACHLTEEHLQTPVVSTTCDEVLTEDFISNISDTWLTFLIDLVARAKYRFMLDETGRVLFAPNQDLKSLQPVWTYTDDNSSILQSSVTTERDLYGIPNVVEVFYSKNAGYLYARVENDDPYSLISTVSRGREVLYRDSNPSIAGNPTQKEIDDYATQLLRNLSSLEYSLTYTHGYCPVRVGDCIRFNYTRAGLTDIKAKVTSQTIKCTPGCQVTEKAVFTTDLWG